ncbi:MAG: hypothetical protein ACRDQ5_01590 [Sciscionella sp.]
MDMSSLRDLCQASGPFASVYFEDSHDTEDADQEVALRWRGVRDKLEADGADEDTLAALDEAVAHAPPPVGKSGRAIVAAGGKVLLDWSLAGPPRDAVGRYSRLPYLVPLLEQHGASVPHVVVVADRTGAEVYGYGADNRLITEESVDGEAGPMHKARGEALKHRKAQQRVEDTVAQNAAEVADKVDMLISRTGAQLLVIAGEIQARAALREQLSPRAAEIAVETETGGRAAGTDQKALRDAVSALVAEQAQAREADVIERFQAESGRDEGKALQGIDGVVAALRLGNVATVLVADPRFAGRTVGVGLDGSDVSTGDDLGAEATTEPADEALLVAAALTGASAVYVPHVELTEGVGAVLRHT